MEERGIRFLFFLGLKIIVYGIPFVCTDGTGADAKLMVCYYANSRFSPVEKVPADLCTHIIYAFGDISFKGITPRNPSDVDAYRTLMTLKKKNPQLKVLLSLQKGFPDVVDLGSEIIMERFSASAIRFLQTHGFDGVDLDWEFPNSLQKRHYQKFIQIFRSYLQKASLLMSAALPNNAALFKRGYDVNTLSDNMDFMTAMTYDFHLYTKVDNLTGYNSPLYTPKGESQFLSTAAMMTFYLGEGLPSNKLLMGVPTYGRSWTLVSSAHQGLHSPASGKGGPSPYTKINGVYYYQDTCVALQQGSQLKFDKVNGAVYLYHNTTWVAFDNANTTDLKLTYMKEKKLAGVGIWAMHLDDMDGVCKQGPLPLLHAIKASLGRQI